MMKSIIETQSQEDLFHSFKTPLAIIRLHSEHLLEAQDRLSARQMSILLKDIQSQTILLEHLLDEMGRSED
jgi:K+-sensing histidine kinase KdpD